MALSPDERKSTLSRAVQEQLRYGGRIESASDFQVVLLFGESVNHLLHFLIGILTIGAWWIVWLILAVSNRRIRRSLYIDEAGVIHSQDVPV